MKQCHYSIANVRSKFGNGRDIILAEYRFDDVQWIMLTVSQLLVVNTWWHTFITTLPSSLSTLLCSRVVLTGSCLSFCLSMWAPQLMQEFVFISTQTAKFQLKITNFICYGNHILRSTVV